MIQMVRKKMLHWRGHSCRNDTELMWVQACQSHCIISHVWWPGFSRRLLGIQYLSEALYVEVDGDLLGNRVNINKTFPFRHKTPVFFVLNILVFSALPVKCQSLLTLNWKTSETYQWQIPIGDLG